MGGSIDVGDIGGAFGCMAKIILVAVLTIIGLVSFIIWTYI